ncbi:AAA family ATPase [Candidatus Pelagibacter sp.]|nr:AAA family ATPase [Candidatus Pelagibacter sp.]
MPKFNLNQLRLKNFRAFTELTKINFGSRITLIFGKGSVGKSTIIDAINLLSSSYKNKTNLLDNTNRFHLSKKTKLKEILLGFTVGEGFEVHKGGNEDKRGIDQYFTQNKEGEFYPSNIELYSELDDSDNNKFVSIQNTPYGKEILKDNKFLEGFVNSNVLFIENENSWKELYEYTYKHLDKLIKNLNECRKFNTKRDIIRLKISKIQTKNNKKFKLASEFTEKDKKNIDKLRAEERNIFDESFEARGFNPAMFPFLKILSNKKNIKEKQDLIDVHINFLKKKPNYKKFIKYITDDIKNQKSYLYKNYKLYKARDLFAELRGADIDFYQGKRGFGKVLTDIDGSRNTLSEFLCTSLTTICTKDFEFIDKEVFKWDDEVSGKILTADGMFSACNKMFWPLLNQIKVVRHQENFNNIARTLSQFGSSSTLTTSFHKNIEENVKAINRWYSEFGYDFNISIDKVGPRGETEIMYKKDKFKIPSDLGGSGAQHLLTFLSEIISSQDNTILLEEPEKALHASMQIKLAKLFSETSKNNQLIIETHSENLLYGLLKEVRDKKISTEEIKIIYVYMENGESKIDELELNDKGGFKSKWRDGFFTEKLDLL